jgi:hypothetical protein
LTDFGAYQDLYKALTHLPVQTAAEWLTAIDAATLPTTPEQFPRTADEWLAQWFTDDTLPTWPLLRNIYQQPPAPDSTIGGLYPMINPLIGEQ